MFGPDGSGGSWRILAAVRWEGTEEMEDREEGRCCPELICAWGCRVDKRTKYVSNAATVRNQAQDKREKQTEQYTLSEQQ